jgi:hypothetical protein
VPPPIRTDFTHLGDHGDARLVKGVAVVVEILNLPKAVNALKSAKITGRGQVSVRPLKDVFQARNNSFEVLRRHVDVPPDLPNCSVKDGVG